MFFNIFGKKNIKKEDNLLSTTDAIFKLKETLSLQEKKEVFLEKTIEKMKNDAKECMKKNNKNKALSILKLCKTKEKHLNHLYGIKTNLENQIFALEQTINNEVVIKSIKHGKKALDKFKTEYDVDDTAELMDDINEHIVTSSEIGNVLSQSIGDSYDNDDLLKELEEEELLSEMTKVPILPEIPNSKIKSTVVETDEEKELRELQKEFDFPTVPIKPIKVKDDSLLS
jgi:charged multivesicular body protein 6